MIQRVPIRVVTLAAAALAAVATSAQEAAPTHAWCANVLVPQARTFHTKPAAPRVALASVRADVAIDGPLATTTLHLTVRNDGDELGEAELLVPVPDGAVLTAFTFDGAAEAPTARVLARDEATATYRRIVADLRDPALLEFAGRGLLRTSVFPVPARGELALHLTYRDVLRAEGDRVDYVLPRSSVLAGVPTEISVEIGGETKVLDVYSSTHPLVSSTETGNVRHSVLKSATGRVQPGDFRLSILASDSAFGSTLYTTADPSGIGGWFMLLATGSPELVADGRAPAREVTLVIDRSGSMAGAKFEQAIEAARQVVEGLRDGEAVQIIDYANDVARFAPAPVIKSAETIEALRAYLASLASTGGTNLDGALQAALAQPPTPGHLPVVLFLTDGLPTKGETREHVIRERAEAGNPHNRRVFTFGVGNDVNAPLLDAVANTSRGRATYVRPEENVESAIGGVFADLAGPLVTDLAFTAHDAAGVHSTRIVRDVHPRVLPDLYAGDRVMVVGRYTGGTDVATLRLTGLSGEQRVTWTAVADLRRADGEHDFVRRLWAMRHVAALEDDLRTQGADPAQLAALRDDPRFKETIAALLDIATKHGVLSDSTAFLAREGSVALGGDALLATACSGNWSNNAQRAGTHGIAQQLNIQTNRSQAWLNTSNELVDPSGSVVAASGVVQCGRRAYFASESGWVDGRIALDDSLEPDRTVVIGTAAYEALLDALEAEGRLREACLAGAMLIELGGERILVTPEAARTTPVELDMEAAPKGAATARIDW